MAAPHRIGSICSRIAFAALLLGVSGCGFPEARGDAFEVPDDETTDRGPWIDPSQDLAVDRGSLARVSDPPGRLQRERELEVSGGYFDFVAVHTYEAATEPDVRIRCAW